MGTPSFGSWVREARTTLDLTQEALAERTGGGLEPSATTCTRWCARGATAHLVHDPRDETATRDRHATYSVR